MSAKEIQDTFTRQCAEWQAIRVELFDRLGLVTAHQVTTEHRKRMLARGEHEVTADELRKAVESEQRQGKSDG